jgi:hypothetical protein
LLGVLTVHSLTRKSSALAILGLLIGAILAAVPGVRVFAQTSGEPTPIAVVSVASLEKIFTDADYLGGVMGQPEATKSMRADMGAKYGIDVSKPIGMWIAASKDKPDELDQGFFIPVSDPKLFDAALGNIGFRAAAEQDGVKQYSSLFPIPNLPPMLYGKLVGSTFFLTTTSGAMTRLPRDPAALLGDLPTKFLVGGKVQSKGVAPESMAALAKLMASVNSTPAGAPGIPGFDMSAITRAQEANAKQVAQAMGDINEMNMGVRFDTATRAIRGEWDVSYKPGSNLAKKFASIKSMKSNVSGVYSLGNVWQFLQVDSITAPEREVYQASGQMMKQMVESGLSQLGGANQEPRKKFVEDFSALLDETMAAGSYDASSAVRIEGKDVTVAAGMVVSDGKKVAAMLKTLAESEKSNPDFPEVLFDYVTHQNVAIHYAKFPTPEQGNVKKAFGDEIDIAVGTSDKTVWVALGAGAIDQLKKAIDESALGASKQLDKTTQMKISLTPILQFVGATEAQPGTLKSIGEAAGKFTGNAVIESHSQASEQGYKGELTVSEDNFKLIRDVVNAAIASAVGLR